MKRFLQIILGFFAVIFAITGIIVLTLRYKLTDSNLYKDAVEESSIYVLLENPKEYFSTSNDDVQIFLVPILENINLGDLIRVTVETNIDYITNWLKGDELFLYFPRDKLVQSVNSEDFRNDAIEGFTEAFYNLPECSESQILKYESQINEGDNFIPECKPSNSDEIFLEQKAELERRLNEILSDDSNVQRIIEETDLKFFSEKTSIQTLLDRMSSEERERVEKALNLTDKFVLYSKLLGFSLVIASLIFTLINLFTVKNFKNALIIFSNTYIFTGVILFIPILTLKVLLQIIKNAYESGQIEFSDERAKPFFESLIKATQYIVSNITTMWIVISLVMILFCVVMRIASKRQFSAVGSKI